MSDFLVPSIPAEYDYINYKNSIVMPSTVHVQNTGLSRYYRRYLLQKAISVFKWTMPEGWAENYVLYVLYTLGFVGIIDTEKFGVQALQCGLRGYNIQYQPTTVIISNPLLPDTKEKRIGKEAVLLRLQPDYGGIMDMVGYYADLMALASETASVNLANSKLSYVFTAANKAAAESFKKLFDRVASGELCVVQDKALVNPDGSPAWQAFEQNVGANYIVPEILADMRKIEAMFDTDIGIPNANTDKRERLITDEVNANNVETASKCELWLESLKKSCKQARDMFGIELDVDWRVNPKEVTGNEVESYA